MIEAVTRFQTSDGKLHEDASKAKAHDLDRLCALIDSKINLADNPRLTKTDTFALITRMFPDYESAIKFVREASKIMLD
jgi:hypothetical protein